MTQREYIHTHSEKSRKRDRSRWRETIGRGREGDGNQERSRKRCRGSFTPQDLSYSRCPCLSNDYGASVVRRPWHAPAMQAQRGRQRPGWASTPQVTSLSLPVPLPSGERCADSAACLCGWWAALGDSGCIESHAGNRLWAAGQL